MKANSTFKDMVHVTLGNLVSFASSMLNGFIIPILLGTLNYGYYKIFVLYASYESLTHFGFNDGIMLSYAGKHYNDLDGYTFRSNTTFFFAFQLIISIIISGLALFASSYFYKLLFIFLGINNFTLNVRGYYQNISQIVMRFDEYSLVNVIQYICLIVAVLIMWFCYKFLSLTNINFIPYVCILIFINTILDLWYLYDYRRITFGKHAPWITRLRLFKNYFISGAYVTLGYGISILIFNLDSQFVVKFFNTRTYGIYAFAYSMFSAGLIILQAAGPVLLPHLRRASKKYILNNYSKNISCILLLVYLAIVGYFPLKIVISKFLFKYYNSLIYFRLLLPGMAITCCMTLIVSNYYYALKRVKFYFYLSLATLFISFLMDTVFYILFRSPRELALSSTLSLLIWYTISNYFMGKWYYIKWIKTFIYIILMAISFLIISDFSDLLLGIIFYLIIYFIISLIFFKSVLIRLTHRLIKDVINNV